MMMCIFIVGSAKKRFMQFHTLTEAIFSLEKMVGSEGQPSQILVQLHKLSKQVASFVKIYESVISQNKQNQKEKQQLKKKLKKTTAKLEKKEQECEQLQNELTRTKDMYKHKLSKLIKFQENNPRNDQRGNERIIQKRVSGFNKSKDIQCQILNQSLVKELKEQTIFLQRKINILRQELNQEKNESNSKQLYIESLISALDAQTQEDPPSEEDRMSETVPSAGCSDNYDISTIDADSLKDEELQSEVFPEGQKKIWHECDSQTVEHRQRWYSSMLNAFNRARTWLWRP